MAQINTAQVQREAISTATGKTLPAVGRSREELYFAAENAKAIEALKAKK